MPLRRLNTAVRLVRVMGMPWVAYRVRRMVSQRLRRPERHLPAGTWTDYDAERLCGMGAADVAATMRERRPLKVDAAGLQSTIERESPDVSTAIAEDVRHLRAGWMSFFSGDRFETGWPPAWHTNVVDGTQTSTEHFCRISTFGNGDIKNFWESGRFGFVILLIRAHARGVADDAAELFWQAVEDFAEQNPPMCGVQHLCGQETAIRSMMMMVGWSVFADAPETTDERLALLWSMLAANGRRIDGDIEYALSQKNNHGISEAVGLYLIGLMLQSHPNSIRWVSRGRQLLEQQLDELVYPDGGFSQHSANYHRIMMQALTFCLAVSRAQGQRFSVVQKKLGLAAEFLWAITETATGYVPRYGNDDGAHILPWAGDRYDDFRPTIQDALSVTESGWRLPAGPWDEGSSWLGRMITGRDAEPHRPLKILQDGGFAVLRSSEMMLTCRVPCPAHRSTHLDTLHVDVWWRGNCVALDPGTYRYNVEGRWDQIPLAQDAAHNVVGVSQVPQADQVGRFLFLPWPAASISDQSECSVSTVYDGSIGSIQEWKRTIQLVAVDICCVIDDVALSAEDQCELRWHLSDLPKESREQGHTQLTTDAGPVTFAMHARGATSQREDWVHGDKTSTRGWYASRYGQLHPCLDVLLTATGSRLTFCTVFAAGNVRVRDAGDRWIVQRDGQEFTVTG